MIKFKCGSCDKAYQLPDNAAGRKARCKACGEAMVVPDAPDDLFDDSASAGDDLTSLYSSADSAEPIEPAAAGEEPLVFNPDIGFKHDPKEHRSAGLPKIYVFAGGGGALALIILVVVIAIVMSGGDKDEDGKADALAFDPNVAAPAGRVNPSSGNTSGESDPESPVGEPEVSDPDGSDSEPPIIFDLEDTGDSDPPVEEPPVEDPPVEEPVEEGDDALSVTAPNSSSYAIVLPEGLELISKTRVAVRTSTHADGTWLSMEVHKLAGLDRREVSPVSADGSTVLLRGQRIAMPEGVEVSDLATDLYTAKRLLYPIKPGDKTRRVEYVIKDGPYLISVLGRFPVNDDARLAMLDEAAKSVQPIEGD